MTDRERAQHIAKNWTVGPLIRQHLANEIEDALAVARAAARAEALEETSSYRAALEHIVRECGAMNKGPVAVEIARVALAAKL